VALPGDHKPAGTLLGVAALFRSGYLIEVGAFAVTDG
jgi:enamine deaminase RidA (YjgF/YER057c/UK114 family)